MSARGRAAIAAFAVLGVAAIAVVALLFVSTIRSVPLESYQRTADERKIVVIATVGVGDQVLGSQVQETDRQVTVIVRVRQPSGARILLGVAVPVIVDIAAPLGERAVVDQNGRELPEKGTFRAP